MFGAVCLDGSKNKNYACGALLDFVGGTWLDGAAACLSRPACTHIGYVNYGSGPRWQLRYVNADNAATAAAAAAARNDSALHFPAPDTVGCS